MVAVQARAAGVVLAAQPPAPGSYRRAAQARPCNVLADAWAAIAGCAGVGRNFRFTVGADGIRRAEWACAACRAFEERAERGGAAFLRRRREALRIPANEMPLVQRRGGRPVLAMIGHRARNGVVTVPAARPLFSRQVITAAWTETVRRAA